MSPQPPKVEVPRNNAPEIDLRVIIQTLEKERGSTLEELNDDDRYWLKELAKEFGIGSAKPLTIGSYSWAIERSIRGMQEGDENLNKQYVEQLENLLRKVVPPVGARSAEAAA